MPKPSAKPRQRGGRPARSEAEWWNEQRIDAFEQMRRGEKPAVPRRTLEGWQASPYWQAKLAKREDKREAVAVSMEVERTKLLEEGCTAAVRAWTDIVTHSSSEFARIQAGGQLWALKLKLDQQSQQRQLTRVWDITFSAEVWE